jgi:G3E family GTPase
VVSKTDLATPEALATLKSRLRALNPIAPILEAVAGAISPAALLATGPFDPAAKAADVAAWIGTARQCYG